MSDKLENVFRYLNNEMSFEEQAIFEQLLETDKELAKEVVFQKGLIGFLERQQPELEQKLDKLGDRYILNKKGFSWWKSLLILIVLGIFIVPLYLFVIQPKPLDKPMEEMPSETQAPVLEEAPSENENIKETLKDEPIRAKSTLPTVPENQPIAVLDTKEFEPNPILEGLIDDNFRTENEKVTTIIEPKPNAVFDALPVVNLRVIGSTNGIPPYELIVYVNKSFEIENDYRIIAKNLDGQAKGGENHFRFNGEIPLPKGLYYLVLRQKNDRKVLHIGRFTVE